MDSGSEDDSVSYLREKYPEVSVVRRENRGFGAACNQGALKATGIFVMFLNEDMYLPDDFLERMLAKYSAVQARDPQIGALACNQHTYDRKPHPDFPKVLPGHLDPFGFGVPNRKGELWGAIIPGCPFFIKRELFLQSGGFCENIFLYGDDTDLSWRLVLMGKRNYSAPEIHLYHYIGGTMEGLPPRKIYYFLLSTSIAVFNNYSAGFLLIFLPLNILFTLTVVQLGFVVFTRGNLAYNREALRAVADFLRRIPALIPFRKKVQRLRILSDTEFLRTYLDLRPSLLVSRSYTRLPRLGWGSRSPHVTALAKDPRSHD